MNKFVTRPLVLLALLVGCGDDGGTAIDASIADASIADANIPDAVTIDAALPLTISSITPDFGLIGGGTTVLISGSGFEADGAGATVVLIGATACEAITVINDATVQCSTPAGRLGVATVSVSNDLGSGTTLFQYAGIYAADGKTGAAGNLYEINPADASATVVGPVGYGITGLALAPDGKLFGSQSTRSGNLGNGNLISVDRETGAGTPIGELLDPATTIVHNSTADMDFLDDKLLGWSENGDDPITIDISTGTVSVIGDSGVSSSGSGIAVDSVGTIWFIPGRVDGNLYIINPLTGLGFQGPALSGGTYDNINSLTFFNGQLFGVDTQDQGTTTSLQNLVRINTTTGVMTTIGPLPTGIDSIAASRR